jgi:hypothetical protein
VWLMARKMQAAENYLFIPLGVVKLFGDIGFPLRTVE